MSVVALAVLVIVVAFSTLISLKHKIRRVSNQLIECRVSVPFHSQIARTQSWKVKPLFNEFELITAFVKVFISLEDLSNNILRICRTKKICSWKLVWHSDVSVLIDNAIEHWLVLLFVFFLLYWLHFCISFSLQLSWTDKPIMSLINMTLSKYGQRRTPEHRGRWAKIHQRFTLDRSTTWSWTNCQPEVK